MKQVKPPNRLAKLVSYILGRRPDEFGLAPDPEGFVRLKDLLKAICEEDGWKHVRRSHLQEIQITLPDPPFEIVDNLVRAKDRARLPARSPAKNPPKLLYAWVRERAHPVVSVKGVQPPGGGGLVLSASRSMAERMGRRVDQNPVILTVNTARSMQHGVRFVQIGEGLFGADAIPPGCFSGPPVPAQRPEPAKPALPETERARSAPGSFLPGSFLMDARPPGARPGKDFRKPGGRRDKTDKIARKKAIKQERRKRRKMWGP